MTEAGKAKCPACDFLGDREQLRKHFLKMRKQDLALHLVNTIVAMDFWISKL
jgi:hypothetical protein